MIKPCCEAKYTGRKEHVVEEVKKNSKVVVLRVFSDENNTLLYILYGKGT
jgi:hypothetical protein